MIQYKRDLNKAREELSKSKYADNLDEYPVYISYCAEAAEQEKVALLIQACAAELGIKVQITRKPYGLMCADLQTIETTPNGSFVFYSPHYTEAGAVLMGRYHSSSCGTWEQGEWLQDPEIDALIEDALATIDEAERFAKYGEIQMRLTELCPTLWLFDQAERRAYQAAYIYWPTAEAARAGEVWTLPAGYWLYVHDMKIDPAKRAELLK